MTKELTEIHGLNGKQKLAIVQMVELGLDHLVDQPIMRQLAAQGYFDKQHKQTGRRGRPEVFYTVATKGEALRNLSKGWK